MRQILIIMLSSILGFGMVSCDRLNNPADWGNNGGGKEDGREGNDDEKQFFPLALLEGETGVVSQTETITFIDGELISDNLGTTEFTFELNNEDGTKETIELTVPGNPVVIGDYEFSIIDFDKNPNRNGEDGKWFVILNITKDS